ncbi:MAG: hydrogenase iron-sulfur subunit [Armatimonadota bacterium]|nr:hydrogenase iron-sulfur subunit [Armatimonadota bacterium]
MSEITPATQPVGDQASTERHEAPIAPEAAESTRDPIILGFLCEWAANMNGLLDADGVVQGMPNVRCIKIPCSGMTKPAWLEMAMKQGADGVFVCGCPIVDCHFREGNVFIRDRMYSRRTPKPKRLDAARMRGYWYEALETDKLMDDLRQFTAELKGLIAAGK